MIASNQFTESVDRMYYITKVFKVCLLTMHTQQRLLLC